MTTGKRERRLRRAAVAAWAAVAVLSLLLVADGVAERGRVARETARIEALEERVLTEAAAAEELAAVCELQTTRSVARETRNHRLGWALVAAVVVALSAVKWEQALRGEPAPEVAGRAELVQIGGGAGLSAPAAAAGHARPPEPDLSVVGEVVARCGSGREATIPILQALQDRYRYLPEAALRRVCELTEIAPSDIIGVASFYAQFRRRPIGRHLVRVCHGTACHVAGVGPIMDELRRRLEIPPDGDSDPALRFTLDPVNCLGCCSLAPVMMVDELVAGRLTPNTACQALEAAEAEA